jgi:LPS export ABC transporter protein LptC
MLDWRKRKSTIYIIKMLQTYRNHILSIVAILFVTMLFSCQDRLNEVRKWDLDEGKPQTAGKGINLFYTDSGKVKANLRTPLMNDFTHLDFSYREFPDGLELDFFDEENKKNTIIADYGIMYEQTDLVDLQGNVVITTADSTVLKAKQLYWDQQRGWVFSDINYNVKLNNGALNEGEGFDANEKFDKFISRSNKGVQIVEETE